MGLLKMYSLLKMGDFPTAMSVFRIVYHGNYKVEKSAARKISPTHQPIHPQNAICASFTAGCCTRHSLGMAEAGVLLAAWRHLVEKMEEVMMVVMVMVWRP